jgi:hypothetical protein
MYITDSLLGTGVTVGTRNFVLKNLNRGVQICKAHSLLCVAVAAVFALLCSNTIRCGSVGSDEGISYDMPGLCFALECFMHNWLPRSVASNLAGQ